MLSVWCVLNGSKYQDEDAYILKSMVSRHLNQPHDFYCLSDRQVGDLNCLIPSERWPGWWSKLLLFRYATGHCLYLDLDTVVVGNLDRLLSDTLSMPANWAQSGHGGCQSSVMAWNGDYTRIPNAFDPDQLEKPVSGNCGAYQGLWGDQELITRVMGDPGKGNVVPMNHIVSYKYHCRMLLPPSTSVVCFHGEPKPDQVHDAWVIKARSYTATGN
jgi:hypothetical protein